MRILIIGGSGLVGKYLTSLCVLRGYKVFVLGRTDKGMKQPVQFLKADISISGYLNNLKIKASDFDIVVHLAYATSGNVSYDRSVTFNSVIESLNFFSNSDIKHFIYCGSMSVFGEHPSQNLIDEKSSRIADSDYARNKLNACEALMNAKVSFLVSILHPTGVYDAFSNRITSYRNILRNGYIVTDNGGGGVNNIIHAKDVASSIIKCFKRAFGNRAEEYIINGELISYKKWFSIIEQNIGVEKLPRLSSKFSLICRFRQFRYLFSIISGSRLPITLPAYKRAFFERAVVFSSNKAKKHFGFEPKCRFKNTLKFKETVI